MPPSFGQPEAVPASTGPTLELMSMWAVEAEPRMGGPLMKALAAAVPLTGLQHLKRVRKQGGGLQVLLCRVDWRQQAENDDQQLGGSQAASAAQQQGQPQADGSGAGEAGSPTCNGAANGASGSSGGQAPDLPPAAADIVQQHSLQLFIAQVTGSTSWSAVCHSALSCAVCPCLPAPFCPTHCIGVHHALHWRAASPANWLCYLSAPSRLPHRCRCTRPSHVSSWWNGASTGR